MRKAYTILVGNPHRKGLLVRQGTSERIILKWISYKFYGYKVNLAGSERVKLLAVVVM
jgi:hypothetical protein